MRQPHTIWNGNVENTKKYLISEKEMITINLLKPKWAGVYFIQRMFCDGKQIGGDIPSFYMGKDKFGFDNIKTKPHTWPRLYSQSFSK